MIDTILVIGAWDKPTPVKMLVGGFEVHIGNDPDYNNNPKCLGGPYLDCVGCNFYD